MTIVTDYPTWRVEIQQMLGILDPNGIALFDAIEDEIINYAELRCYRDLQLIDTDNIASFQLTTGNRFLALPVGAEVVLKQCNLITPAPNVTGKRTPVRRADKPFIDVACPDDGVMGPPAYYDFFTTTSLIFGPVPDRNYYVELTGTVRPPSLGDSTADPTRLATTVLTTRFPDLFLAASMIFCSGYTKNFGAQADDPKMAMSWEMVYQTIKAGASMEEALKSRGAEPVSTAAQRS